MDTPVISSARELRDLLLRDDPLTLEDLQRFIEGPGATEGLYVDYKAADELKKPDKDRNHTIRQYVAAFANSEGGVLIIGVREPTDDERKKGKKPFIDPIDSTSATTIDKNGLKPWAAQVTRDLVGALGGPPRVSILNTGSTTDATPPGHVLLIAVPRAPSLVSVINKGTPAYYFRIEDQAREVPQSLVVDLLLGRRSVPHLIVEPSGTATADRRTVPHSDPRRHQTRHSPTTRLSFSLRVINDSIVTARDTAVGLVFMGRFDDRRDVDHHATRPRPQQPPQALLESISRHDLTPSSLEADHFFRSVVREDMPHALFHVPLRWERTPTDPVSRFATLRPFDSRNLDVHDEAVECLHLDEELGDSAFVVACALYLLPEGAEPLWFQIAIHTHSHDMKGLDPRTHNVREFRPANALVTVTRAVGVRPHVGCAVPHDLLPEAHAPQRRSTP